MKTTQQHNIDHVTEKVPAPEIAFGNKHALRRRPTGLHHAVVIATTGVAATVAVIAGLLFGSSSPKLIPSTPHPADTAALAANATTPDTLPTQPATPNRQNATPPMSTAKPKNKTLTTQPTSAKNTEIQPVEPATQPIPKFQIAQALPQELIPAPVYPQIVEVQTQLEIPHQPTQSTNSQLSTRQISPPKSASQQKSHIGQLIADVQERPKKARNLSTRKLDSRVFENPNLLGIADGLRKNTAENNLTELFSKKPN